MAKGDGWLSRECALAPVLARAASFEFARYSKPDLNTVSASMDVANTPSGE